MSVSGATQFTYILSSVDPITLAGLTNPQHLGRTTLGKIRESIEVAMAGFIADRIADRTFNRLGVAHAVRSLARAFPDNHSSCRNSPEDFYDDLTRASENGPSLKHHTLSNAISSLQTLGIIQSNDRAGFLRALGTSIAIRYYTDVALMLNIITENELWSARVLGQMPS